MNTVIVQKEISKKLQKNLLSLSKELGIPSRLLGSKYIHDAICILLNNGKVPVTKILYPQIAQINKTTPNKVEKAIRHAIEVSWNRSNPKLKREIFGYIVNSNKKKPTNSEFLFEVYEYCKLNFE